MEPTLEQQKRRYLDAGLPLPQELQQQVMTVDDLTSDPARALYMPPVAAKDYSAQLDAGLQGILDRYMQPTQAESTQNDLQQRLIASLEKLGTQTQRRQELEAQQGLPQQRQDLQDVINNLNALATKRASIPLEIQQASEGRGRTAGGTAPLEARDLRQNAIDALRYQAIGQTLQGNIALAEQTVQSALDAEFEPEMTKLTILQQLYAFNKDELERTDKKKSDALNIVLAERERILQIQRADRENVYNIGLKAREFGADNATVQKILNAESPEEAMIMAGSWLRDPQKDLEMQQIIQQMSLNEQEATLRYAQYELDKLQFEEEIAQNNARLQLERERLALAQSEFDMLSAEKWQMQQEEARNEEIKQEQIKDAAVVSAMKIQDDLDTLKNLYSSHGLQIRVGTNRVGRQGSIIGSNPAVMMYEAQGYGQNFAGKIHNLVSGLTLTELQDAKAQGATFGALSDAELYILAQAATAISDWEIEKDGVGTGYWEIDEGSFKREMKTIEKYFNLALERSRRGIITDKEDALLDSVVSQYNTIN